jgi:hypothetical protein
MAATIFINYRRGESFKDARHLATLLAKPFGARRIFLDARSIDGGADWLQTIERQVAASGAMLALIGKGWAEVKDEHGNRRLDSPDDFVRFEIAQALQRNIPVLPVLLDGAAMPKATELPAQIQALSRFHAMPLRTESIEQDALTIARRLKALLAERRPRGLPAWAAVLGGAALLVAGIAAGPFVLSELRLAFPGVPVSAEVQIAQQERDAARRALESANTQIAELTKQLDASQGETKKAQGQLEQAQKDRDGLKAALAAALQERDAARRALESANAQIAELTKQLDASQGETKKAQGQLEQAQKDRDGLKAALAAALQERDEARGALARAMAMIEVLQKELAAAKEALAKAQAGSNACAGKAAPLAGAAKASFMKKCCEDSAVGEDGNPLAGAARTRFMDKCLAG